jgi:hypothetical protein
MNDVRINLTLPHFVLRLAGGGAVSTLVYRAQARILPRYWVSRFDVQGVELLSIKVHDEEQLARSVACGGDAIPLRALLGMLVMLQSVDPHKCLTVELRNPGEALDFEAAIVERFPVSPGDFGFGWHGSRGVGR